MPARKLWILTMLACVAAQTRAEDPALTQLHASLEPLRRLAAGNTYDAPGFWTRNSSGELLRFAPLALTPAKRQLRDWIETRLARTSENVRPGALTAELNSELRRANLLCKQTDRDDAPDRCDYDHADWNATGFVFPEIHVDRPGADLLLVRAGLGIECGTDSSAYAYEWRDGRWQRFWQDELPIQEGTPYRPRTIDSVSISRIDPKSGTRLVLALGHMDWCSSTFYPIYARLWRVGAGGTAPQLLQDLDEQAHLMDDPPVTGHVTLNDAQIEFMRPGIDVGGAHEAVVHFEIDADSIRRVDPVARTPAGFIEEWLHMEWEQSRRWVGAGAGDLSDRHRKLRDDVSTDSVRTLRCRDRRDWQVTMSMEFTDDHRETIYFRVRRTADQFQMLSIGTLENPDCDGPADQ